MMFWKKKRDFVSPMSGTVLEIENVPDPAFAQKMMGDGFAIIPSEGKIYAPVNGRIMMTFPTKHALGIQAEDGTEILIHAGIDTVELKGKGFNMYVEENQYVKQGDILMEADIDYIKKQGKSPITIIIFTSGNSVVLKKHGEVKAMDGIAQITN